MLGQTQVHIYKGSKKVTMVQKHRAKLIGHRAKDMEKMHRNRVECTRARAYRL